MSETVAALFVEPAGCYFGLPRVDPWDMTRDARTYAGPHPVVAHPPCARWGRYWHGSPCKPHQFAKGDDNGCFAAALAAVRRWGGVLEHPADSHAWRAFGLLTPPRGGGWVNADWDGAWVCCVEQGHYGHMARKPTWLLAVGADLPSLRWGPALQRLPQIALDRYGYEKARRIGVMSYVGGKHKTQIRSATPLPFRDLLLTIARTARRPDLAHQHAVKEGPVRILDRVAGQHGGQIPGGHRSLALLTNLPAIAPVKLDSDVRHTLHGPEFAAPVNRLTTP